MTRPATLDTAHGTITFPHVQVEDADRPQYAVTLFGGASPDTIDRMRDQLAEALDTGKPIVLPDGAVIYDARKGYPPTRMPAPPTDLPFVPFVMGAMVALLIVLTVMVFWSLLSAAGL